MVNQLAMWFRKSLAPLSLWLALLVAGAPGCAPRLTPVTPEGLSLTPGRYLTSFYRAPGFEPSRAVYVIKPFSVEQAQGLPSETFGTIFQEELVRAWQANGLRLAPQGEAILSGAIHSVKLRGTSLRFLTGSINVDLTVSGAIVKGGETLFAFKDHLHLASPVKPGPQAPKETELLLRDAARTLASHLLNEMLLYGFPAEGK
jgi:hypothetical protein